MEDSLIVRLIPLTVYNLTNVKISTSLTVGRPAEAGRPGP